MIITGEAAVRWSGNPLCQGALEAESSQLVPSTVSRLKSLWNDNTKRELN